MLRPRSHRSRRCLPVILLRAGLLLAPLFIGPGCAGWDLRGPGFGERNDTGMVGQRVRQPADEGDLFGFSTKAREIERNVGIR